MIIIDKEITTQELQEMTEKMFGNLVKAVVDIEFDSMTNLRPSQGNRSRGVEDIKIQEKIKDIVSRLVKR
jgi:hypothetical protein